MGDKNLHPVPWTIEYDNDTGPNDEGFWEWWTILDANGDRVARCDDEPTAKLIVALATSKDRPDAN